MTNELFTKDNPEELEGIIKHILKIDSDARDVISRAMEARSESERNIITQKIELRNKYLERAHNRVEAIEAEEVQLMNEAEKIAFEKVKMTLQTIENTYKKMSSVWEDQIFKAVISN